MSVIPMVVEPSPNGERVYDVFTALLKRNTIHITGGINDEMAAVVKSQILFLGSVDNKNPIKILIDSPGGSVTAALGILDCMQSVSNPVITICTGQAASMGAILLVAGDKRLIYPNARVLIHQPLMNGLGGQASEIELASKEIRRMKRQLYDIIVENTGATLEQVTQDCDRDHVLTAQQALKYGIYGFVDEIVPSQKKKPVRTPRRRRRA